MTDASRGARQSEDRRPVTTTGTCIWTEDDDGVWWTGCNTAFAFEAEGVEANGFKWCPFCGARIDAKPQEEEEDEDD